MNDYTLNKLDNIISELDNCHEAKEIRRVKSVLVNNKELLDKIDLIKQTGYSKDYVDSKRELLNNEDYKSYKDLEYEFIKFSNSISKKLSSLTK